MNEKSTLPQTDETPDESVIELPEYKKRSTPSFESSLYIPLAYIQPNPFFRRSGALELEVMELAGSIEELGLLEPIAVRKISDTSYQIISGELRFRAFKLLNKTEIPCCVFNCSDPDMAVMAITANIKREDLSDYETFITIQRLRKKFPDRAKLAKSLGISLEEMHTYLVYDAMPALAIEKLEADPWLFNKATAYKIKKVFAKTTSKDYEAALIALKTALALLEDFDLYECDVAEYIEEELIQIQASETIEEIFVDGKQIGYFLISADTSFDIRIFPRVFNAEQAEGYINDLMQYLELTRKKQHE